MRTIRFTLGVTVLASAILTAGCSMGPGSDPSTTADPAPPTSTAFVADSARDTAVRAVALTGAVAAAGFATRPDLISSFTTADFAPVLLDRTNEQLRELAREFVAEGVGLSALQAVETPLAVNVVETDAGARASVWSVLVVVVAGSGPARQFWRTVTLDLVQVDGQWRVDSWDSAPGPTPVPLTDASFDDASAFELPLSWDSPTFGGGR